MLVGLYTASEQQRDMLTALRSWGGPIQKREQHAQIERWERSMLSTL